MDPSLMWNLLYSVLLSLLVVIPLWRVFGRAGLHPALSLLVFIPVFGFLIVLGVLAFTRWPNVEGVR